MRTLYWTTLVITVVGAINWGLWGLFQWDLVASLFDGQSGPISRTVYSLVGLCAVILAGLHINREDSAKLVDIERYRRAS